MNQQPAGFNLKVPALAKGVALLEAVAREPGLSFSGIQERLGLPKSSTHHLISTLCELGLIKPRLSGGYALGLRLLELAGLANENNDLQRDAMPLLRELAQQVGLTCHLGVLERSEAVYLARVESAQDIVVKSRVGQRFPVNCSALGKALIAWLPSDEIGAVIAGLTFEKRMPNTVRSVDEFRSNLATVRRQGWALDDEEQAPNCRCIAAPIRERSGSVVAAISVVGTLEQVEEKHFQALASQVKAVASTISESAYGATVSPESPQQLRALSGSKAR